MAIGLTEEQFWHMNPRRYAVYIDAYKQRQQLKDTDMWYMGMYIVSAATVALDRVLNGRKARSKYLEKPLLQLYEDHTYHDCSELPEEEKDRLRKQLAKKLTMMGEEVNRVRKKGGDENG